MSEHHQSCETHRAHECTCMAQLVGTAGPITVAVSGRRDYTDARRVDEIMGEIHRIVGIGLVIQGECPVLEGGLDELSRRWAKRNEINCLSVPPKVRKHGWPSAGPIRNREMGALKPHLWVLFPGGAGTDSARQVACSMRIKRIEVDRA